MDSYIHDVSELEAITQVKRKYIDRMYEIMPELEKYRRKSPELNKYFYNSGAIDIFHRIYELKRLGLNRREIKDRFEKDGLGRVEEPQKETMEVNGEEQGSTPPSSETTPAAATTSSTELQLINALRESHTQALKVYEDMANKAQAEKEEFRSENKELRTENKDLRQAILAALPGKVEKTSQELPELGNKGGEEMSSFTHRES